MYQGDYVSKEDALNTLFIFSGSTNNATAFLKLSFNKPTARKENFHVRIQRSTNGKSLNILDSFPFASLGPFYISFLSISFPLEHRIS